MGFTDTMTPAQMKRDLAQRMIDCIVADDDFRRDIVEDPYAAMDRAGLIDDHDELVDAVSSTSEAQAYAAFGLGLKKLRGAESEVVYPTWVLGPTCSATPSD